MKLTELVPQSCRVCLKRTPKLRSLYQPLDEGEEPPNEMLRLITGVVLERADIYETLPKCICKSCELSLSMAYQFRDKVLQTHKIIENYRKRMWCTEEVDTGANNTITSEVKEEFDQFTNSNDFNDEISANEGHNRDMKVEMLEVTISENDAYDVVMNNEEEMLEINVQDDMEEECKSEYLYEEEYYNNADTSLLQSDEPSSNEEVAAFNYEVDNIEQDYDIEEPHFIDNESDPLPEENGGYTAQVKPHPWSKNNTEEQCKHEVADNGQEERIKQFTDSEQKIEASTTPSGKKSNRPKGTTGHICDVCGNIYPKRGRMMEHRRRHDKELRYPCEICNERFHLREKLRMHMFLHTGGKPHKCSFCSRTFFYESVKKAHEAVHSGIKPYVCDVCNKAFAYAHALVKHKLIHADIKLYHCEYCDKDFRLQHHMKQHIETKLHKNAVYAAKLKFGKDKLTNVEPASTSFAQNSR